MLALQALQRFVNYSPKPALWSDLQPRGQEWVGLALHHEAPQARGQRLIIKRQRCVSFHLIYGFHRKPVHPQHRLGHLITECLRQQPERVSRLRKKCAETERTAPQVERKTVQRTTVFPAIIHGAAGTHIGTHLTFYQGC